MYSAIVCPGFLAAGYKAAERLDVKGFVRAVERAVMAAVAKGRVQLSELAVAFAGCPRIAALCDNYLDLPGVRPPPPFDIEERLPALVEEHGAVFLICMHVLGYGLPVSFGSVKIVTDVPRCRELASTCPICREIVEYIDPDDDDDDEEDGDPISVFTLPEGIEDRDMIYPSATGTWLHGTNMRGITRHTCAPSELHDTIKHYAFDTVVTLAVCREGRKLFSLDAKADTAFKSGVYAAFGQKTLIW